MAPRGSLPLRVSRGKTDTRCSVQIRHRFSSESYNGTKFIRIRSGVFFHSSSATGPFMEHPRAGHAALPTAYALLRPCARYSHGQCISEVSYMISIATALKHNRFIVCNMFGLRLKRKHPQTNCNMSHFRAYVVCVCVCFCVQATGDAGDQDLVLDWRQLRPFARTHKCTICYT